MEIWLAIIWLVLLISIGIYVKVEKKLTLPIRGIYLNLYVLFVVLSFWGTVHTLVVLMRNSFQTTMYSYNCSTLSSILVACALATLWRMILNDIIEKSIQRNPPP